MDLPPPPPPTPTPTHPPKLFYIPFFTNREVSHALLFFLILITSVMFYNAVKPSDSTSLLDVNFLYQFLSNSPKNYSSSQVCDYSYGKWVWDESYPGRKYAENCPFLDPGFRCQKNGRQDMNYQKWRWRPQGCDLPRLVLFLFFFFFFYYISNITLFKKI